MEAWPGSGSSVWCLLDKQAPGPGGGVDAPTSTHSARIQRFAGTEKKILDEPCTPANHKQKMHKD